MKIKRGSFCINILLIFAIVLLECVPQCMAQHSQHNNQQRQQYYHQQQQQQQKPPADTTEFYKVLSVSKTASDVEIKKAYKKLAIKYHPDKNLDNQEESKAKFQEVSNAYEVLSDPEKRRIYDTQGVEGVQQNDQRQGQQNGDPYNHFYQFHQQQRQQQEHIPDLFSQTDVLQLDFSNIGSFYKRQEIWVIYFFNPKLQVCQQGKDEYVALAEKLYGIIQIASMDCHSEEELCESFSAYDIPQLLVFQENSNDDGERYSGEFAWNPIATFASKKMQSFVSFVSSQNYEQFTQRDRLTKNKVILFTDKKSTPAIYKALSKKYLNYLVFGEVRSEQTELIERFQVRSFPTIVVLTNPDFEFTPYEGEFKVDQLQKFFSTFAHQTPKTTKTRQLEFLPLNQKSVENGNCGSKDSYFCFILFAEVWQEPRIFEPLLSKFVNEPINFGWIGTWEEFPGHHMHQQMFEGAKAIIYKPKRLKWLSLKVKEWKELEFQISDVLGGGGEWKSTTALEFINSKDEL